MRRRRAEKREVIPDPKYKSAVVSRFINIVMLEGFPQPPPPPLRLPLLSPLLLLLPPLLLGSLHKLLLRGLNGLLALPLLVLRVGIKMMGHLKKGRFTPS